MKAWRVYFHMKKVSLDLDYLFERNCPHKLDGQNWDWEVGLLELRDLRLLVLDLAWNTSYDLETNSQGIAKCRFVGSWVFPMLGEKDLRS